MNGFKVSIILFVIGIVFSLIGITGIFSTIGLVMASYVLFLTIFKIENHAAYAASAGFFAFMFIMGILGL